MINLNEIVSCFLMQSNTMTHDEANTILLDLSNKDDFYLNSLNIFYSNESSLSTKFFVTQVLKNSVQKRWNYICPSFQDEVRKFILSYFFSNPFHKETSIDSLIFQLLFTILCYEWPGQWPSFFNSLFDNLDNSEITNILSLKFISYVINETQGNSLTSVRAFAVSNAFESKTPIYFNFIQNLLFKGEASKEVIIASFSFLTACIPWIPTDLFIESNFFLQLADTFFRNKEHAEVIIPFLTQLIITLNLPPDKQVLVSQIFNILMNIKGKINNPLSFVSAIKTCYDFYGRVVEMTTNIDQLKDALDIILKITNEADDLENPDLLEICLSFWAEICQRLIIDKSPIISNLYLPYTYPILEVLFTKIPPPFSIATHFDELEIEHSIMENSSYRSNIYSNIKQCLIFLINLNENAVMDFILQKIDLLQNDIGNNISNGNNTDNIFNQSDYDIIRLSWMIYSAAGSFSESIEDKKFAFLNTSLLNFVKKSRPYVVINIIMALFQYQRYMKKFPEKLTVLTHKIYELLNNFTHEVRFVSIYILKTCPIQCKQIIIQQSLFNDLISFSNALKEKLCDDCNIELYNVYGLFIKELPDGKQKEDILSTILQLPLITNAADININKQLLLSLKCHIALQSKITLNYLNFLKEFNFQQLFLTYSNELLQQSEVQTKSKSQNDLIRSIYLVKCTIVELVTQFISFCFKPDIVNNFIIPTFMDSFLNDYMLSPNDLRAFHTLKFAHYTLLRSDVPVSNVFYSIFSPTFSMISHNFDDYQEFRLPFYSFITAIIHRHFSFLMQMKTAELDEFIQIIMYGCNHININISQLSLNLLTDFVSNLKGTDRFSEIFSQFCPTLIKFAMTLLSNLSFKSNFEEIAGLVRAIFSYQEEIGKYGPSIVEELVSIFPLIKPSDLIELVKSLTECGFYLEGIRILLRDFIIELGQISPLDEDIINEKNHLSTLIRHSFEDNAQELTTADLTVEEQLSQGIRSISFNH